MRDGGTTSGPLPPQTLPCVYSMTLRNACKKCPMNHLVVNLFAFGRRPFHKLRDVGWNLG